jgi:ABC-type transport system involved in multi-copper enzyme maturation permease subunit
MKRNGAVKGLILYFFHSSAEGAMVSLAATSILGAAALIIGEPIFFSMISVFGIVLISCSFIISSNKDAASKWNKFQLALPVKRGEIIAAKYLGHLILLFAGLVLAGIFIVLGIILHDVPIEAAKADALLWIPACIGASLLAGALFYPAAYTIAVNKEEPFALTCIFGAGGISALILWLGHGLRFKGGVNAAFCIGISALLFAVSYIVAKKVFAKKDI